MINTGLFIENPIANSRASLSGRLKKRSVTDALCKGEYTVNSLCFH